MAATGRAQRFLPNGVPLRNRLLAALPADVYALVVQELRMKDVAVGETVIEHGVAIGSVYFPNSGVYSLTNEMRDGSLVEVATIGCEGMLGANAFLGDMMGAGRALLQYETGHCRSWRLAASSSSPRSLARSARPSAATFRPTPCK